MLTFGYSVSGGAYSYLIRNQSITASNGPLPTIFRVGFAASDGGASNVHEIMCFKAAPTNQSGSSATVNEKEAAKVEAGTQAYFAFYNPDIWTGTVTANALLDDGTGAVSVATTANWDAGCLLSGTNSGAPAAGGGCTSTNTNGPTGASPLPAGRVMITWDTAAGTGIPFEWANLNAAQQAALTFGDSSPTNARLEYLRGDRTNEINSTGVGLYRARDAILGDIVDSSPAWVGPPSSPYTSAWMDRLYPSAVMAENSGQTYVQFTAVEQTRLNVVYVGSNDGYLPAWIPRRELRRQRQLRGQRHHSQRRRGSAGLHAGIDAHERRVALHRRRLHQLCEYRDRRSKYPWRDPGRRGERGMRGGASRLFEFAIRPQFLRRRDPGHGRSVL